MGYIGVEEFRDRNVMPMEHIGLENDVIISVRGAITKIPLLLYYVYHNALLIFYGAFFKITICIYFTYY